MRLVLAVTTYNRLRYLRAMLGSWEATRSRSHTWSLVVADDGSTDGTLEWLEAEYPWAVVLRHRRRGIHHQVNALLRYCSGFDLGFRADDDVVFLRTGWDERYLEGVGATGYDHLVFHDLKWVRKKREREVVRDGTGLLECRAWLDDTQGAFWTWTPRVVERVGYFDLKAFGLCGFGHRDYTFRCCRAGFNELGSVFDVAGSNEYVGLNLDRYETANDAFRQWNTPVRRAWKMELLEDAARVYVGWNEVGWDLYRRPCFGAY